GSRDGAPVCLVRNRLLRCFYDRVDRHVGSAVGFVLERHRAFDERKEGMVLADADIDARVPLGAALTDQDVAGEHLLAAELLDAEASSCGIAAFARGTASLLMCHCCSPSPLTYSFSALAAAASLSALARGGLPAISSLACSTHSSRSMRP